MSTWLIPCNSRVFRIHDYLQSNSIVDWKQSHYKFDIGDIVYIYCSHPEMSVRYMFVVEQTNIDYKSAIKHLEYWSDECFAAKAIKQNNFIRIRLINYANTQDLHLSMLLKHGLKKAPQGPCRIEGDILDYIESKFK